MKKAVIVSCFDWYEQRIDPIWNFLSGFCDVSVLMSDFNHLTKQYETKHEECTYIHVPAYTKNLSIDRVRSHVVFANRVKEYLFTKKPDLVYALVPPNMVAEVCATFKRESPNTKLIFDIIDMWPESMPCSNGKINPVYLLWRKLRDNSLTYADLVFTECDLYKSLLHNVLPHNITTLHLFKKQTDEERDLVCKIKREVPSAKNELKIGFVGSINNIIDISAIERVIREIANMYRVTVFVIGDGESRDCLLQTLDRAGASVKYYGKVFDEKKKIEILSPCNYALNIMKKEVSVGLTIKSIDYLSYGLPLINNIKGDTWKLVEKRNIGINVFDESFKLPSSLLEESIQRGINAQNVYCELFTENVFIKKISDKILNM